MLKIVFAAGSSNKHCPAWYLYCNTVACLVIFREPSKPWLRSSPRKNDLTPAHPDFSSSFLRGKSRVAIKMSSNDCWIRGLVTEVKEKNSHSIASGRPVSSPGVCTTPISRIYCRASLPMTELCIEPLAEYQGVVWMMAAQSILFCY